MPRISSVDRLPRAIRERIGQLRQDGATLDDILAHLAGMQVGVSRSALGRHVQRMEKMGARLRQSRALAEGLARQLGDAPGDQVARVNIELMHSFLSDALAAAGDEESEHGEQLRETLRNPKGAALFAEAVERLTKASRHNQDFVERIEKRAKAAAAAQAEAAAVQEGLSAGTIEAIKKRILGIG